jgi:hypothetical protein
MARPGSPVTPLMELYARRKELYRPMHKRSRSDSNTPNR